MRSGWKSAIIVLASIAAAERVAKADVIYRETFGNAGTSQAALSTAGWTVNAHATGDNINNASPQDAAISNVAGRPSNLGNVNAGTSTSASLGLVFVSNGGTTVKSTDPVLCWTSEFTLNQSAYTVSDFSFYMGNANKNDPMRVAIEIGSDWYVSNTSFRNTANLSGTDFVTKAELETLPFSTDAAAWSVLNFTPNSVLSVGSTLTDPLPAGNIVAFGLFSPSGRSSNVRFDTFTVDVVVPEPASLGILSAMLPAALIRRKRVGHGTK